MTLTAHPTGGFIPCLIAYRTSLSTDPPMFFFFGWKRLGVHGLRVGQGHQDFQQLIVAHWAQSLGLVAPEHNARLRDPATPSIWLASFWLLFTTPPPKKKQHKNKTQTPHNKTKQHNLVGPILLSTERSKPTFWSRFALAHRSSQAQVRQFCEFALGHELQHGLSELPQVLLRLIHLLPGTGQEAVA